jgi:DsbC/DsbD-like thiol-disulfide interchange protein
VVAVLALGSVTAAAQSQRKGRHTRASLLAEVESLRPGESFWVGVRLQMEEPWHTYWKNPGDSGLATRVRWRLPDGLSAGPLVWPRPERMPSGPLMSYGYGGEVLLLTEMTPARHLSARSAVIEARVDWLECNEACLPGRAELRLELPVGDHPPRPVVAWRPLFQRSRRLLPVKLVGWREALSVSEGALTLSLSPPAGAKALGADAYFFPAEPEWIEHAAPQRLAETPDGLSLTMERARNAVPPGTLIGVLVAGSGPEARAYEIEARAR